LTEKDTEERVRKGEVRKKLKKERRSPS